MKVEIFKNTNFGNNDLVWNVPHPEYDYSQHESQTFDNVNLRFPLLTTAIVLNGTYDFNTTFYDYMIVTNGDEKTYYFINSIIADRNALILAVTLDAITTYNVLSKQISGVIVRKHDTDRNEDRFKYPTALAVEGNFTNEYYEVIGYSENVTKFIESTVNLKQIKPSVTINSSGGGAITVPTLPVPSHTTDYEVETWSSFVAKDNSNAFTLYDASLVSQDILDTVRGLSGDGAISDSFTIPSEAIQVVKSGSEITKVRGKLLRKTCNMKLNNNEIGFTPRNEAIKGMFNITFMSLQEKTKITFPAWDLQESIEDDGKIKVTIWCDPKPSGAPYISPAYVFSLYPLSSDSINALATLESKSVRGGQWLRNPLIYNTGKGEIFSTIETRLQRERSAYEKQVSLQQLEMSRREREIAIAKEDYNYQAGMASNLLGVGMSLVTKDFGGALSQATSAMNGVVNRGFVEQMRSLQNYQMESEKQLINMAHTNNLKNLNVQEQIRRVVPREVVFEPNESMGAYEQYNGFVIIKEIPDTETLRAKDDEYSKYGYPVYERVYNFKMLDNLREKHTVYQFENPLIEIGGQVGDMVRTVLQSGIRILSKKYSINNILNNPKITTGIDVNAT